MLMVHGINRIQFPLLALLLILITTTTPTFAQFEQKLSFSVKGGLFNTVGQKGYSPEWSSGDDDQDPTLMPNFKPGFNLGGSFQVNINRHFSIEASAGIMLSLGWYFDHSDAGQEAYNYLYYETYADTIDWEVDISGENELLLTNLVFGLAPKYYFLPSNKLNPFVFAGVDYHLTNVNFIHNEYTAYEERGILDELEVGDESHWFSNHTGLGFSLGAGVELKVNEFLGLFALAGYYYLPLKEEAFVNETKYADFNAINVQVGARFSFMKSKEF